jgi:hypothetical protein
VLVRITVECGGFTRAADACLTVSRDGSTTTPTAVRVVLLSDPRTASGWRILTAFPD